MRTLLGIMVFQVFLGLSVRAQTPEKSAFEQHLESNNFVTTNERWIERDGLRYREVEYKNERYLIRFTQPESAELQCGLTGKNLQPKLIATSVQVTRRAKAFIEFLERSCENINGRDRVTVRLDPRIGFTLPEDSKSVIKNKKVFLGPTGPGFSGEW